MERTLSTIQNLLLTRGLVTSTDLARWADTSQPTVSRAIARLGGAVRKIGNARSTLYVHIRTIDGVGHEWPLYKIHTDGRISVEGRLTSLIDGWLFVPVHEESILVRGCEIPTWFPDLPWFIDDMRPRDYMGLRTAKALDTSWNVSRDCAVWSDDDIVRYLVEYGRNEIGDYILGDAMLKEHLLDRLEVHQDTLVLDRNEYDAFISETTPEASTTYNRGNTPGHHPMFIARRAEHGTKRDLVVKFSEIFNSDAENRRADLLALEHMALCHLSNTGVRVVESHLYSSPYNVFLEVARIDRAIIQTTSHGTSHGRKSLVSLASIDRHLLKMPHNTTWHSYANVLHGKDLISAHDRLAIIKTYWFNTLIGNTRMTSSGLSFTLQDYGHMELAPMYGISPSWLENAHTGQPHISLPFISPSISDREVWSTMFNAASGFWTAVAIHEQLSVETRNIAKDVLKQFELVAREYLLH